MTGRLTIDKSSGNLSYFLYSIKLLYDAGGQMTRADFVNHMADFIEVPPANEDGRENRTPFNKSKLPQYFGFIDIRNDADGNSALVLTPRGSRAAGLIFDSGLNEPSERFTISAENRLAFADLIFESLLFDSFGKNNCGVEESNSDVEPPKILFRLLLDLEGCTNYEFYFVIYGLNDLMFETYEAAVSQIRTNRENGVFDYTGELERMHVLNAANDSKLIKFLSDENVGLICARRNDREVFCTLNRDLLRNHLSDVEKLHPIAEPLRMFLYFKNSAGALGWIKNTILGRVTDPNLIDEVTEANFGDFWGCGGDGGYRPGLFDSTLLKSLSNPKKNFYLIIHAPTERELVELFAERDTLLRFRTGLADQESGWSVASYRDSQLYEFLRNANERAVEHLRRDEVRIPPNLHIIGVIEMDTLDNEEIADYHFERAVIDDADPVENTGNKVKGGYSKIYYGVPGCGKSTYIKRTVLNGVPDDGKHIFRTTFHPEYSNSDFVGQIMPKIEKDDAGEDAVTYSFAPGPFALALKEAYARDEMVYLVIEEINRGNASAIFGDIFQLLDRIKDSDDPKYGESEFPITNVALQDYLSKELHREIKEIKIPSNLTILATMNTSDQNVFTMDTAFKRRWSFEQIGNEFGDDHPYKNWYVPGTNVTWETFLNKTNEAILGFKIANSSNEDKRMGKFFVTKDCLTENENTDSPETAKNFAYKVLEYLWNDVCKFNREEMFDTANNKTLEELIKHFVGDTHLGIFVNPNFGNQN